MTPTGFAVAVGITFIALSIQLVFIARLWS